jgi:hypothetical protein
MDGLSKKGRFVRICKRNADDAGEKGVLINYFGLVLASGVWPIFIDYDLKPEEKQCRRSMTTFGTRLIPRRTWDDYSFAAPEKLSRAFCWLDT